MLSVEEKKAIVAKYGANENDTGSPEVQIALLTARIVYLTEHLRSNKKTMHPAAACSNWLASAVTCLLISRNMTLAVIVLFSKN